LIPREEYFIILFMSLEKLNQEIQQEELNSNRALDGAQERALQVIENVRSMLDSYEKAVREHKISGKEAHNIAEALEPVSETLKETLGLTK
jgi:hypothetical protein